MMFLGFLYENLCFGYAPVIFCFNVCNTILVNGWCRIRFQTGETI